MGPCVLLALGIAALVPPHLLAGEMLVADQQMPPLTTDDECQLMGLEGAFSPYCALNALQFRGDRKVVRVGKEVREKQQVRILHISDTHNLHRSIEKSFPLPPADILIHTGDVSNYGTGKEFDDFNEWLGEIKHRYPHIFVITGNHDWVDLLKRIKRGRAQPKHALHPDFMRRKLSNAQLLQDEEVEVLGIRVFGTSWNPWYGIGAPGDTDPVTTNGWWKVERRRIFDAHEKLAKQEGNGTATSNSYSKIPKGIDVLLSHGPAWSIFDETIHGKWGSSKELRSAIEEKRPRMHLCGHVHEQRGLWQKVASSVYKGGVEYQPIPGSGKTFMPRVPPPVDYPVELAVNNAMENNGVLETSMGGHPTPWNHIAGPARLIIATWTAGEWNFSASSQS